MLNCCGNCVIKLWLKFAQLLSFTTSRVSRFFELAKSWGQKYLIIHSYTGLLRSQTSTIFLLTINCFSPLSTPPITTTKFNTYITNTRQEVY